MKVKTPPNTLLHQFFLKNFYKGDSTIPNDNGKIWYSKIDGSFFTIVRLEDEKEWMFKKGITEQIQNHNNGKNHTSNIGFNPIEQKWYGWSHRAVFGFGIGSTCKQGNCGFKPSCKKEFIERELSFWGDRKYSQNKPEAIDKGDGVLITYIFNNDVPNEKLRGTTYEHFCEYPAKWGKGEWTAETLEDAKQMAIDFAKSVS